MEKDREAFDAAVFVDELAQEIRRVDGQNKLGAGALAEALMPLIERRVQAALAYALEERGGDFRPTHRHVKRGSTYRMIGEAEAQVSCDAGGSPAKWRNLHDGCRLAIYQGSDGKLWARFIEEFTDGRFERITDAGRRALAEHEGEGSATPPAPR